MQNLKRHFENIHEQKRYHCEECNKPFNTLAGATVHRRDVHEGRRVKCTEGEKTFSQFSSLNKH